jgi:histidinol-phosphate phosphatase family protein
VTERCVYDVVIPTVGRSNLTSLLAALLASRDAPPASITVVDDRARGAPLRFPSLADAGSSVLVMRSFARGPAAARNVGWRCGRAPWVVFLDDDVLTTPRWSHALASDLAIAADVAAVQGRVVVPLPSSRRPTDWERTVHGLQDARWITADMAVRRHALEDVAGFDERFPRAYREDADLALRLTDRGWRLGQGARLTLHPATPTTPWVSLKAQAGNADDVVMSALHGRDWFERAGASRGCINLHRLNVAAGAAATGAALLRRPAVALPAAGVWAMALARFSWSRIAPGPRTPRELASMLATSPLIPPLAVWHRFRGQLRVRRLGIKRLPRPRIGPRHEPPARLRRRVAAVLFDRDGTLTFDVPYNGDPDRVRVVPGAAEGIARLRGAGVAVAAVSNQSGVALGLIDEAQVDAVNRRVDEVLGPLDGWFCCFHAPEDGCACRKPEAGLVCEAAAALGVDPERCAVIGDTGADVEAAARAGAVGILVPTAATRRAEVDGAGLVAPTIRDAVDIVLRGYSA